MRTAGRRVWVSENDFAGSLADLSDSRISYLANAVRDLPQLLTKPSAKDASNQSSSANRTPIRQPQSIRRRRSVAPDGDASAPPTARSSEKRWTAEPTRSTDSQIVDIGPARRQIPKRLRRAVLARDRKCVIDSCRSSYRLQTHHVIPRSDGGDNTADNLATLCWYHHHIAIQRKGHPTHPHTPPHRRRLLPPRTWDSYRHPTNIEYLSPYQQQERAYQNFLNKYHPQQPHPGG